MATSRAVPVVGDTVKVAWGFDIVHARVQEVYRSPRGPRLVLAIPILDTEGNTLAETSVSLPLDALEE